MNKTLKFNVDDVKIIQDLSDSQNAIAEIKVCHTGMNKHELPISLESLKKASSTLVNKWLVAGWDGYSDFKGHEGKEQRIIGFFPKENNFRYIEEDGKIYLVANAIISKMYASWAFEVFEEENFRECSMEIQVLEMEHRDDGYKWIHTFIFNAVTVLGRSRSAACPGSSVEIIKFSEDELVKIRDKIYNQCFEKSEDLNIKIDNSKESATNGGWSNPGSKLYKPILGASNKTALVNEAYLISESGYEDSPSTKLKYPHHVVKDNKLILHIRGVQSAFERAKQQGLNGEPIEHIKRHYNELGLSKENFAIFGLTYDEYINYFYEEELVKEDDKMEFAKTPEMFAKLDEFCKGIKYSKEDKEMCKYSIVDYSDTYMYCYDFEDKKMTAIPYEYAENSIKANIEGKKKAKAKINYEAVEDEDETEDDFAVMMSLFESIFATDANLEPAANVARSKEETDGDKEAVEKTEEVEQDENKDKEDFEAKVQEIQSDMDNKVKEFEAKISEIEQENKELKEFKSNILEQEKNTKIEFTATEVLESGMPKEKVDEWKEKVVDFSSIDAWANAVKADAFNYVKNTATNGVKNEAFNRMGLPYSIDNGKDKKSSLWDD